MGILPNKRQILESIIDEQDDFWIIMKPSRNNPTDQTICACFKILPNAKKHG